MKMIQFIALTVIILGAIFTTSAQTWTQASAPSGYWQSIASSADGRILIAASGTTSGGVFVSTNFGTTWLLTSAPSSSLGYAFGTCVASSADGGKLVDAIFGGAIFISSDFGNTWIKSGASNMNWNAVACSSDGSKIVAVAGNASGGGIFVSTNFGISWIQSRAPSGYWRRAACSADGSIDVASVDPGKIYTSTNSGLDWTLTTAPTYNGVDSYIWSVATSADGIKMLVAGGFNGLGIGFIYASTNCGVTWNQINISSHSWNSICMSADGSKLVTIGDGLTYVSTDCGQTWSRTGLPNLGLNANGAISVDGNRFVAEQWNSGIYLSCFDFSPQLQLTNANQNLTISWLIPSTNFVLQQSSDLANWSAVTNVPALNFTNLQNQVTLPVTSDNTFFRLSTP